MKQPIFVIPLLLFVFGLFTIGYCQEKPEEEVKEKVQKGLEELDRSKFKTEIPEEIAPAGFLGIFITSPQVDSGAEVDDIVPGSPAAKAGIKKGDIILEINGQKVIDEEFLVNSITKTKVGDKVNLKIRRNGKVITFTLQPVTRPDSLFEPITESWINKIERTLGFSKNYLGIKTCNIVPGLDEYFGVEEGALILEVFEESCAEKFSIKPGDVIVGIDEQKITDCQNLRNIMRKKRIGSLIMIKLIRHQKTMMIKGILAND